MASAQKLCGRAEELTIAGEGDVFRVYASSGAGQAVLQGGKELGAESAGAFHFLAYPVNDKNASHRPLPLPDWVILHQRGRLAVPETCRLIVPVR